MCAHSLPDFEQDDARIASRKIPTAGYRRTVPIGQLRGSSI